MSDPISEIQSSAERLALVVSAFYNQLRRDGVPKSTAQLLTLKYQGDLMQMARYAPSTPADDDPAAGTRTT